MARKRTLKKAKVVAVVIGVALLLLALIAGAYTFFIQRGDESYVDHGSGHYDTIIPKNSPLRNSDAQQSPCNGGFSPNPCTQSIPEPSTWLLILVGIIGFILTKKR